MFCWNDHYYVDSRIPCRHLCSMASFSRAQHKVAQDGNGPLIFRLGFQLAGQSTTAACCIAVSPDFLVGIGRRIITYMVQQRSVHTSLFFFFFLLLLIARFFSGRSEATKGSSRFLTYLPFLSRLGLSIVMSYLADVFCWILLTRALALAFRDRRKHKACLDPDLNPELP